MLREDKIKLFINELNYIKDSNLRKFGEEVIANAEDWFFIEPASTTGKYHPKFSLGEGGLMRHTRCVAYWATALCESFNMNSEDSDLLVIAALAHDIKKHDNNGRFLREHPLLASNYIREIQKKFNEEVISNIQIEKICGAVASHMGKWEGTREWVKDETKELFPMPKTEFEKLMQAADYIASRKPVLEFDFLPVEDVKPIVVENKERPDVNSYSFNDLENFVLPFGMHSGKMFKEVLPTGYLEWMAKQVDFNNKYEQELAQRYLYLVDNVKYYMYKPK
jgi:uncharacterized protein (DUF3820 family)